MTDRETTPRSCLVRAADHSRMVEESFRHPFNPRSELHGYDLARAVGLERTGLLLARVPPGRESYAQHAHAAQEEWFYVVSGRAVVEIGEDEFELAPGDFVGFPAGAPPHHVRNVGSEDLVYLCGGERTHVDVVEYPSAGRVVVQVGARATVYPAAAGETMFE